mmetsp:Transcript_36733/g.86192  ORF Transcript_36733/g.86192 Transcript_36733/m.86192 type:complete len:284 (+) Transcript_36733:52-903(+)
MRYAGHAKGGVWTMFATSALQVAGSVPLSRRDLVGREKCCEDQCGTFIVNSTCSVARVRDCGEEASRRMAPCCESGCVCEWYGSESAHQCSSGDCFETNGICGETGRALTDVLTGGGNILPLVIALVVCLIFIYCLRRQRLMLRSRRIAELEATRASVEQARVTAGQVPTAVPCDDGTPVVGLPIARYGVLSGAHPQTHVDASRTHSEVSRTETAASCTPSYGMMNSPALGPDPGRTATATSYESYGPRSRASTLEGIECMQCKTHNPSDAKFCLGCGKPVMR